MGGNEKESKDENNKPNERSYKGNGQSVVHPSAVILVKNQETRVVIDTLSSSNYIGSELISKLNLKPKRKERRDIEQMFGDVSKLVEIYEVELQSKSKDFHMTMECINIERDIITQLPNPEIAELKKKQPQLRRIRFSEEDSKDSKAKLLPVQILLGVSDYNRIRIQSAPVIGRYPDYPVAEQTKMGWILSGGKTIGSAREFCHLTMTGQEQFEKLCRIDVLGIKDDHEPDFNHEVFKSQISSMENNHYSTKLPWKVKHAELPDNKLLSTARLRSTTRKLEKMEKLTDYHTIMCDQLSSGILEEAPEEPTGAVVHYIPHSPVFRDSATTPLRIVYDASARAGPHLPSLNDCLETGPNLLPKIFEILLRNRFRRYVIVGDIQKAFHQIEVDPTDRDAQRVLWYDDLQQRTVKEYRFTRVIFGATSSPYILGATIEKHVDDHKNGVSETTITSLKQDTCR